MSIFKKAVAAAAALALAFSLTSASVLAEADAVTDEQPLTTLMFASDYQADASNPSALNTFASVAKIAIKAKSDRKIDSLIMCGDYTNISGQSNYNGDAAEAQAAAKDIKSQLKRIAPKVSTSLHFLQGNHDAFDESFMDATGAKEYENYILYILNTEDANPWQQGAVGAEQTVKNAAAALNTYLNEKIEEGENRPVIIATHVPLHFSGRTSSLYHGGVGDNMYSSYFFDVINEAAKELNIFFVFGHNHSNGWDSYIGSGSVYKRPGDTLLIPSPETTGTSTDVFTEETLNFTYMNAGYVGHFSNYPSGADTAFTVSVMEIYEDSIAIMRYDSKGLHCLSAAGVNNKYYDDSALIGEQYLSAELQGPDAVERIKHEKASLLGDIDGSGIVDSDDAIALLKYLETAGEPNVTFDFNHDGKVDSDDAVYLLYFTLLPSRYPLS